MARVGVACCAFGNTFTLPLVFLVEVLGAVHGDKVAGFIALYLIGWSPALWTIGYSLLAGGGGEASSSSGAAARGGAPGRSASSSQKEGGFLAALKLAARETVNPPLVGICLGVLIGVTPLRRYLLGGSDAFLSPSLLPPELALVQGAAKALFELAVLIGGAALPGQTLVLASSFVKFDDDAFDGDRAGEGEGGSEDEDARGGKGKKKNASEKTPDSPTSLALARRATMIRVTITAGARAAARSAFDAARGLFSLGASDFRALFVASLVRFFVLPLGGVLGALALKAAGSPWYPEDPIVAVVVLTMAAMPPAQNLVLLTNLREETRHLAPRLAGLLLRMYVLAIPPTTAWLTVFTAAVA
jgi:predicted permease